MAHFVTDFILPKGGDAGGVDEPGCLVNCRALWAGPSTLLVGLISQEDIGASVAPDTSQGIIGCGHFVNGKFFRD